MTTSECLKFLYNLCMHLPKTEDISSINPAADYISPTLSERSHSTSSSQDDGVTSVSVPVSPSSPLSKSIQSSRNVLAKLQQHFRRSPNGGRDRSNNVSSFDSHVSSLHRHDSPSKLEGLSEEERKRLSLEYVQRKVALRFEW
jgi:hypothetical protein